MNLEKVIEEQLQQRLNGKETQEEIDNKIRISVNKTLQQYFYHDKYDSDMDADGYQKVEKDVKAYISDQKNTIEKMIDKYVDNSIQDYVEKAVKRILRSDKIQNKLERMITPIVEDEMQKALDARDLNAYQKTISEKVEKVINQKTKSLLRKITIKVN